MIVTRGFVSNRIVTRGYGYAGVIIAEVIRLASRAGAVLDIRSIIWR